MLSPEHDSEGVREMLCPACGSNYVHPRGAYTRVGKDRWEAAAYDGTTPCGASDYRRSALVNVFACEEGHDFALVIQQHKGNNYVWVEIIDDLEGWLADGSFDGKIRLLEIDRDRSSHERARLFDQQQKRSKKDDIEV